MRMKSRRTLAVLLSMILLLALAPSGFAVDLDPGKNSVTVECVPQGSDFAEDLATATIQADLYLLAPAVRYEEPYENVDSYTYQVPEEGTVFHDLLKTLTEELNGADTPEVPPAEKDVFDQFEHYAQDFAKIVLDSSYTPDPDRFKSATAVAGKTFINVPNLDAGLYLLIIRGQELTEKDSSDHPEKVYVKKTEQASSDENGTPTTLFTTRVLTEDYEYLFKPQLFTLPTKLDKNVQQYNTAYGEWENQLSIYAKPTRVANNGDLKIIKNVNNPGPDPVDFVGEHRPHRYGGHRDRGPQRHWLYGSYRSADGHHSGPGGGHGRRRNRSGSQRRRVYQRPHRSRRRPRHSEPLYGRQQQQL